jgi:hypothetical protein
MVPSQPERDPLPGWSAEQCSELRVTVHEVSEILRRGLVAPTIASAAGLPVDAGMRGRARGIEATPSDASLDARRRQGGRCLV